MDSIIPMATTTTSLSLSELVRKLHLLKFIKFTKREKYLKMFSECFLLKVIERKALILLFCENH